MRHSPVSGHESGGCVRGSSLSRGWWVWAGLALLIATASRCALLWQARGEVTWAAEVAVSLGWGIVFDCLCAVLVAAPWAMVGWLLPSVRFPLLRRWFLRVVAFGYCAFLMFVLVAEWYFWDEFQARFNFIAVDYLIWTQEVWGNITQSYPMPAILGGLVAAGAAAVWGMERLKILGWVASGNDRLGCRALASLCFLLLAGAVGGVARQEWLPAFANQFNREVAKNGLFALGAAFWEMEIDFERFYCTLPQDEAVQRTRRLIEPSPGVAKPGGPDDLRRSVVCPGPEKRWNVILVCMESMSLEFMQSGGSKRGLTPELDRLAIEGVSFSNMLATGTRTVRGMEALTLSLPPTPGQAILYRPGSVGLMTIGSLFGERGYDCAFIYGGDGRFDYMNRYFGSGGYRVVDKPHWSKSDVTFETSWGACDEDLFRKVIAEADAADSGGRPFHHFVMTTSNHRPFQFPDAHVRLKSDTGRKAAVAYSDYAVGQFVAAARKRPWFDRTIFVFCADHCASSAGKSELNIEGYHIPCVIWNPSLVPARRYDALCSQIDVAPTVFGLMDWSFSWNYFGQDLLDEALADGQPDGQPDGGRAYISNYQKIAMMDARGMSILKPGRQHTEYAIEQATERLVPLGGQAELFADTVAAYQSASRLFRSGRLKR